MVYLEINKKNYKYGDPNLIDRLNSHLLNKDNQIFILYFMEGCGPCNATRPEWSKLENVLSNEFIKRQDIVIVSIDKDLADKLKVGDELVSFPTMRFITDKGNTSESYEDSNISKKDRTIDSFVEWIKYKTGETRITKSEVPDKKIKEAKTDDIIKKIGNKTRNKRRHAKKMSSTKKQLGGKWSLKYKRSINCKKPRGFSQKQYCKYGRK